MYTINTPEQLHVARDVLGYYSLPGGYMPGAFTGAMIRLLEVADTLKRVRILGAFPEFIPAIHILTADGGEALVEAVKAAGKQLA